MTQDFEIENYEVFTNFILDKKTGKGALLDLMSDYLNALNVPYAKALLKIIKISDFIDIQTWNNNAHQMKTINIDDLRQFELLITPEPTWPFKKKNKIVTHENIARFKHWHALQKHNFALSRLIYRFKNVTKKTHWEMLSFENKQLRVGWNFLDWVCCCETHFITLNEVIEFSNKLDELNTNFSNLQKAFNGD